jgi:transketolase
LISDLREIKKKCSTLLLSLYKKANAGHIGSSLSCLEIMIYLFFSHKKDDDYVILSKGHAAAALYVVLQQKGEISEQELNTFYADGTKLAAHPPCFEFFPSIPFGTGSLGHGLSLAVGLAFSKKYTKKKREVFCILSEGDCNEGSTWEAALFAGHHQLDNLIVIIDANGLQGLGFSKDIIDMNPWVKKWESFGFKVERIAEGNSFKSIKKAFDKRKEKRPYCFIANTIKGHGVSYMENKMEWHYRSMNEEQYQIGIKDLERT